MLKKLQNQYLIEINDEFIEADTQMRLGLAIKAIELGADIENISNFLAWQEFEEMAAIALNKNGYVTKKNVRFKQNGKRWEIDVVGCKKVIVICIDCKHWHHSIHHSTLKKIVSAQIERVTAFSDSLPNPSIDIECIKWRNAKFVPAILSLIPGPSKFVDNVPVIPVLQLQDFLNQLPAHIESLKHFSRAFSHL
jgi:Holliday junction resolvase-like predicted endonuclease